MNEHRIVLEDLLEYLEKRGIDTAIVIQYKTWYIAKYQTDHNGISRRCGYHYPIQRCSIILPDREIFLSDPKYREKFYKFLKFDTKSVFLGPQSCWYLEKNDRR